MNKYWSVYVIETDKYGESFKHHEPKDAVKKESPNNDIKYCNRAVDDQNVVKKDKEKPTIQHLLFDRRTTMSNHPKVQQPGVQNMEASQKDKTTGKYSNLNQASVSDRLGMKEVITEKLNRKV